MQAQPRSRLRVPDKVQKRKTEEKKGASAKVKPIEKRKVGIKQTVKENSKLCMHAAKLVTKHVALS